jgi:hypothetical protein
MSNMDLNKRITDLGKLTDKSRKLYKEYKELKESEDNHRSALLEEMRIVGLRSAKTDKYTVSVTPRPNIQIQHEQSVIDWIKNTPDVEDDQYIGLKKTEFKPLAMALLKETGEIIPGTELVTTESITIRSK